MFIGSLTCNIKPSLEFCTLFRFLEIDLFASVPCKECFDLDFSQRSLGSPVSFDKATKISQKRLEDLESLISKNRSEKKEQ